MRVKKKLDTVACDSKKTVRNSGVLGSVLGSVLCVVVVVAVVVIGGGPMMMITKTHGLLPPNISSVVADALKYSEPGGQSAIVMTAHTAELSK